MNNINITEKRSSDYNKLFFQNDNQLNKENIQENPVTKEESDSREPIEEVPEVIEEQLNDFESRLKRLTGED